MLNNTVGYVAFQKHNIMTSFLRGPWLCRRLQSVTQERRVDTCLCLQWVKSDKRLRVGGIPPRPRRQNFPVMGSDAESWLPVPLPLEPLCERRSVGRGGVSPD